MAAATERRTKIIATLGPASSSRERIATLEEHAEAVRLVREVQEEVERPVGIMADLQGPKLRLGNLPEPVVLLRGEHVVVVPGDAARSDGELPVSPAVIAEVLQ